MKSLIFRTASCWFTSVTLVLTLAGSFSGCGGTTAESFHPEEVTARQALEQALTAWKNGGQKPESLASGKPGIRFTDERWASGAKLQSFEIEESLDVDGPPQFPVKLTLEGATAPESETYVVIGKDPLWVWTKAEFDRGGGM